MTPLPPLQINVGLRVAKRPGDVFTAIVDPQQMANYFIAHGSGIMKEGTTVEWAFPEMTTAFPVRVLKADSGRTIQFAWKDADETETIVTITLAEAGENATFVQIAEGERACTSNGIRWLKSNTEGWANFLACLKAYLEYGINLRKGAFDPSRMPAS